MSKYSRCTYQAVAKIIADECDGCKRAKGSDTIYTCNCNVNRVASIPQQFIQDYCNKPVDEVWIEVERMSNKDEWKTVLLPSEWGIKILQESS